MEGVVDGLMREILSSINPYDLIVTEFVRVVDCLLPEKVFLKTCPELLQGGKTLSGTPVRMQLLGQHPQAMADNALRAVELGSPGIDLNFGCPAKIVNRSNGGAILLKDPQRVNQIVSAVRKAVPDEFPVTAKIRLGYEDKSMYLENAIAINDAGASELAVHARSKVDGYKPPAYWDYIADINAKLPLPVIANGEIWNKSDALRCIEATGCPDIMVGRGAISLPNLAEVIKTDKLAFTWSQTLDLMLSYTECEIKGQKSTYLPSRIKQWFSYLNRQYPEAKELFRELRIFKTTEEIVAILKIAQLELEK